jgi:5-methylcytosine-specific restriction protein A
MGIITRVKYVAHRAVSKPRSPHWDKVKTAHLERFPVCAACMSFKDLQVHHIKPFHLYPELELVESNLITLCMWKDHDCHIHVGHGGAFPAENPNVVEDAAKALEIRRALQGRKENAQLQAFYVEIMSRRLPKTIR